MRDRWKPSPKHKQPSTQASGIGTGPVPRPAAALAAALALGTWSGSLLAGEVLLPGGLLLALCPLVFVNLGRVGVDFGKVGRGLDHLGRRRAVGLFAIGLLLIGVLSMLRMRAFVRIAQDEYPPRTESNERVVVGHWEALDRRGSVGRVLGDGDPGVIVALDGAPPKEGEWVVLLPGDAAVPLPSGPVPGPRALSGFHSRRRIRADAWYPLDLALGSKGSNAKQDEGPWKRLATHIRDSTIFLQVQSERLRNTLRERLEAVDAEGAPQGLAQALVLGESSAVARDFEGLTRRTGVRHLLAVSGMHVGLISVLLIAPLARRFGRSIGVLLLLLFVVIAGARSPVLRAALAASLVLLAPRAPRRRGSSGPMGSTPGIAPRRVDGASLWSLALAFELIWRPESLGQIGLQLSYLATAGILIGTRPLSLWLRHVAQGLGRLSSLAWASGLWPTGPRLRPTLLGLLWTRAGIVGIALLSTSCAALLATTPVTWAIFGQAAPVGLVLTPLALPLIAIALLLGLLIGLAGLLLGPELPLGPLDWAFGRTGAALEALLGAADKLPGTPLPLPERPVWLLALMGLLILSCLRFQGHGHSWGRFLRGSSFLVAAALLLPWSPTPAQFELHVLDSGHGTCAIARGPGLPALVFDAGSRDRTGLYAEAIEPLLARWDVSHPLIVLSHDHRDHTSALAELVSRRTPALWGGTLSRSLRLPDSVPVVSLLSGSTRLPLPGSGPIEARLHRGRDEWGNEGSVALEFTLRRGSSKWSNGGRMSLAMGVFGFRRVAMKTTGAASTRLLLMGDAEGVGLEAMLEAGFLPRRVDLLLAPHHGSDTRLLEPLLSWTRPREVWVTSAARPAIADELERRGLPWHSPSLSGPLHYTWPKKRQTDPGSQARRRRAWPWTFPGGVAPLDPFWTPPRPLGPVGTGLAVPGATHHPRSRSFPSVWTYPRAPSAVQGSSSVKVRPVGVILGNRP